MGGWLRTSMAWIWLVMAVLLVSRWLLPSMTPRAARVFLP
jgi:hypothetical protein